MIRVTGGSLRGRSIESPPRSKDIRPTTAMMRESIFNRVQTRIQGARFLDLFAGSGIMSLEALSRQAAFALAVEASRRQSRAIQTTYRQLGIPEDSFRVVTRDVNELIAKPNPREPYDIVFMDPPYGFKELPLLVTLLQPNGWLAGDGTIIVEHGRHDPDIEGFERKQYGDSSLSFWTAMS